MQIYDVFWEDPVPVFWDRDTSKYSLGALHQDIDQRGGLYQIYGDHPTYGRNVLLYIGKTNNFTVRFVQHLEGRFFSNVGLSCGFGIVHQEKERIEEDSVLERIEALLISAQQPSLNTLGKHRLPEQCKDIWVNNWDWRKQILPEVSGRMFFGP